MRSKLSLTIFFCSLFFAFCSLSIAQETLTITTYYPSPFGSYRELRSQRTAMGDDYINNSSVCWGGAGAGCPVGSVDPGTGTSLVVEGNVGIGTTGPEGKLSVVGNNASYISSQIRQDGTGDTLLWLSLGDATPWSLGVDNSDSDKFKIASRYELGTLSDRLTIQSDGNVGIGIQAPAAKLHVSSSDLSIRSRHVYGSVATNDAVAVEGYISLPIVDSVTGMLGALINGNAIGVYGLSLGGQYAGYFDGPLYVKVGTDKNLLVRYIANELEIAASNDVGSAYVPLRMDASAYYLMTGNVGIGTTSPDVKLDVDGDIEADLISTGATANVVYLAGGANGGAYKLGRFSSSKRYKENISDFKKGLEIVERLRPVEFNWRNAGDRDFGFIAEEAEEVDPILVVRMHGEVENFKYTQFTAILTNAIKELKKENEGLKARIEALETRLARLEE